MPAHPSNTTNSPPNEASWRLILAGILATRAKFDVHWSLPSYYCLFAARRAHAWYPLKKSNNEPNYGNGNADEPLPFAGAESGTCAHPLG